LTQSLREEANRRLTRLRALKDSTERPDLIDYVHSLCPRDPDSPVGTERHWEPFDYFAPYADALQASVGSEARICFAAPPQHGKTEFTLRALLWVCRFHPGHRHAYVTYSAERAKEVSEDFKRIAEEAGFRVEGTIKYHAVYLGEKLVGRIKFTSVQGALTGYAITGLCIIDDPIKDRESARSAAVRKRIVEWWKSVARARRHPGTSYIVMATRWPGGDLTDHLTKKEGWQYINLKAIAEPDHPDDLDEESQVVLSDPLRRKLGESLSKRKPPEFFREDRADLFWWASMFQGSPRLEGMRVFAAPGSFDETGKPIGPRYYTALPTEARWGFGVDLAYSERTSADFSVVLEGCESEGKLYVTNMLMKQVEATSFLMTLISCRTQRPSAIFRFYGGGTEKGSASFIRAKLGRIFKVIPATGDKLVRATPASITWNLGDILLPDISKFPECAEWLERLVEIVVAFTGTPGELDDPVDALAALHDQLMKRNRMVQALKNKQ
jgi:phage terminase large subunit-like protein